MAANGNHSSILFRRNDHDMTTRGFSAVRKDINRTTDSYQNVYHGMGVGYLSSPADVLVSPLIIWL